MKGKRVFVTVFFRSFLLQTLWNFERMQNIGFLYGIYPILKKIYPDRELRKEALLRHIGFFNTHPYMVNTIFGMVAAMEKDASEGKISTDEVVKTKNNIAGPLAAIGDSFFWATWLPFVVILTISLVIFLWDKPSIRGTIMPLVFFLGVYNAVSLLFCYWSLLMSFRLQNKIIKLMVGLDFQKSMNFIRLIGRAILTILLVFYVVKFTGTLSGILLSGAVFLAGLMLGCLRVSPILLFYVTLAIAGIAALVKFV